MDAPSAELRREVAAVRSELRLQGLADEQTEDRLGELLTSSREGWARPLLWRT